MMRSRYGEEQIIGILKEHQVGHGAKELCRKHTNNGMLSPVKFETRQQKLNGAGV